MDEIKETQGVPSLSATPARFEVVFTDDASNPLTLVSPPLADINEMQMLGENSFSLKVDGNHNEHLRESAQAHLASMLQKFDRFKYSATFHNRLANLHSILGNLVEESAAVRAAIDLEDSAIFSRKLGEVSARQGRIDSAKEILAKIAGEDSIASLRLAAFSVREGDLKAAKYWLTIALDVNPSGYSERLFQGALFIVERRFKEAIGILKIAVDERPNSSVAYCNLGLAYLGLGQIRQASKCLKRSISLDPFNRNALLLYADINAQLGLDDDVIPVLRYFTEFEQKDPAIWERLARSLLKVGLIDDSVTALKCQGAVNPTAGVWNNLGVAYARKKDHARALQAFKQALHSESEGGLALDLLITRNSAHLLSSVGQYEQALAITSHVIAQDQDYDLAGDSEFWDIYSSHVNSLIKLKRFDEAFEVTANLIDAERISSDLAVWIASAEAAHLGVNRNNDARLASTLYWFKSRCPDYFVNDKVAINNIAFGFAEIGALDDALRLIGHVSSYVHFDPYVTATMGLINMRRMKREKGEALYKEAIHLARRPFDKSRIRQKMNIEIAKTYLSTDVKKAVRYLGKASDERLGEDVLRRQALQLAKVISRQ